MRLTRLSLRHYGSFQDTILQFDPAPERLNLVLAPNGAGKSVLRGAFGDLLFGIGAQTPMGFRHGYAGMQISAEGALPDGTPFSLTRRKGRGNTLLGPEDAPLEPALLARLLGGADRALLERLFALDTERLRAGGQGLLASGGALAEALLEAAGGLRPAQRLREELAGLRDQLAPARKSAQRPFYAALDRLVGSRRLLREHLVRPERWLEQERLLAAARERREAASRAAAEAAQSLYRLERVRRLRPLLARHAAAADWLSAHPEAPHLSTELRNQLPQARQAAAQAAEARDMLHHRHAELAARTASIAPDEAVLARAESITALLETAGAVEKAFRALPSLEAEQRSEQARIRALLHALGLDCPASHATEAVPPAAVLARAQRLLRDYARHVDALAALPRTIAEQEAARQKAQAALASLPPPRDAEILAVLVSAIVAEGDPVKVASAAAHATAQANARLEAILARLPLAWRDLATLRALEAPQLGLLRQQAERHGIAQAVHREQVATRERLEAALFATRQERAGLNREGPLPDAAALAAARARRDAGWTLIYRRLFDGEQRDPAAEKAFADGQPLPLAYAAAVAEADRLADLRNAETERVSAAERLDRDIAQHEEAVARACATEAAARRQAQEAEAEWASLLRPLALPTATSAAELEQLLAQRTAALDEAAQLATARAAEDEIRVRQTADTYRLRQALGMPNGPMTRDLRTLLAEAEARQRETRRTENDRARLQEQRQAAEGSLTAAKSALSAAQERMAAWRVDWQTVLTELGRNPREHPEDGAEALRLLEELAPLVREAQQRAERIAAIGDEIVSFTVTCKRLAEELGTTVSADALTVARALGQRLQAGRATAERRTVLAAQRDEAAEALAAAMRQAHAAEAELRAAIAALHTDSLEGAEARILLASERERQESRLTEALHDVLAAGDGLPFETLRQEVAAITPEATEAELLQAREIQAAQQALAEQAAADAARVEAVLDALGNEAAFAQAVQDQHVAVAQIGETLENALLLHTASVMLDTALGAVQVAGDDRLLRRISTAFALLTDGAYPSVISREDEKGMAHLVIRQRDFPGEETMVDELSEGTRDQLFLALRLVAVEDHVAQGTPLPFLGDDILQSFDEGRAAATFRALLDFSRTTQVILLSHHQHLLELAQATLSPGQVHVQRLESQGSNGTAIAARAV